MTDYFCTLTPAGRTKLAQAALLEQPLAITHMVVGDGNPLEMPPAETQEALVHQVYRAPLNKLYAPDEDSSVVIAEMAIPTNQGGWYVNELGLEDDTGTLIAIANYPLTWKPEYTSGTGRVLLVRIMLDVDNAENVALLIDPAAVMASEQYVNLQITDARQDFGQQLQEQADNLQALAEHVDAGSGVEPGTYTKVEVNARGLVVGGSNPSTLNGYGITDAYTKTQADTLLATKQPNLGFTPVQQGGGTGQGTNKVYMGWGGGALRLQVDSSDQGVVWTETNRPKNTASLGNPGWWRCADTGTVRQRGTAPIMTNIMEQRVTFPFAFAESPVVTLGQLNSTIDAAPEISEGQKNEIYASITALDATGFTLTSRRLSGTSTDYVTVMWQAEGRT